MRVVSSFIKKIFLAEVAEVGGYLSGYGQVVVDDEAHSGGAGDGEDVLSGLPDFFFGPVFGAELDEVGTAVAELLGEIGGGAVVHRAVLGLSEERAREERLAWRMG